MLCIIVIPIKSPCLNLNQSISIIGGKMQIQSRWDMGGIDTEIQGKLIFLSIEEAKELYGRLGMAISHYNDTESMAIQHDIWFENRERSER